MTDAKTLRVLIGSIGRRVYLRQWFEQAFAGLGLPGEVHITETNPHSAGFGSTAFRHLLPPYNDATYDSEFIGLCQDLRPDLFFSVNDFELLALESRGLRQQLESMGVLVLGVGDGKHWQVHDKYEMHGALIAHGIDAVPTALLSHAREVHDIRENSQKLIIKDRFGSGSSGLLRVAEKDWDTEIQPALSRAARLGEGTGLSAQDLLVVQPEIAGAEYGMDVVAPLASGRHGVGVLVRQKLAMRAGETDQAVTVSSTDFEELASRLHRWLRHHGSVDVDVIATSDGKQYVLDVNPRFGGGYPFNHLAGANLPALLLVQLAELRHSVPEQAAAGLNASRTSIDHHLQYELGVFSSKYEGVTREMA